MRPNRKIPSSVAISMILGRGVTYSGWALASFLMVFAMIFGGKADRSFWHFMGEDVATAQGKITHVVETNFEINERSVYAHVFEFYDQDGFLIERDAFSNGRAYSTGRSVTVEYVVGNPQHARINGLRTSEFPAWGNIFLLLPFIGLAMVRAGVKRGLHDYRLLQYGQLTKAKLISKTPTNTRINDQLVYKLKFQFKDSLGQQRSHITKTHLIDELVDDEYERLFFNPKDPTQATLVDDIAGRPDLDSTGNLRRSNNKLSLAPMLVPLVLMGPHIFWFI